MNGLPWRSRKNFKHFLETNPNEHTATRNRGDAAQAVLRGKFIAPQAHPKKQENALTVYRIPQLEELESTPKDNRRASTVKEIVQIRADVNDMETRKPFKGPMKQRPSVLKR